MLITKQITTLIDIVNAEDHFKPKNELALEILKRKYEKDGGTCFASCFIHKVNRIIKTSDKVYSKERMDGRCTMNVVFEVDAYVFSSGDILHGCKIIEFIQTSGSTTAIAKVNLLSEKKENIEIGYVTIAKAETQAYSINDIVPVIVQSSEYPLYKPAIIAAVAFAPYYASIPVYMVDQKIEQEEYEYIKQLQKEAKELHAYVKKQPKELLEFYVQLLSPMFKRTPKNWASDNININGYKSVSILDDSFLKNDMGILYMIRPLQLPYGSNLVLISSEANIVQLDEVNKDIHNERTAMVFISLLSTLIKELQTLKEFLDRYSKAEMQKLSQIWIKYAQQKK